MDAVQAVLATAKEVKYDEKRTFSKQLKLQEEIRRINNLQRGLLPIEEAARAELRREINKREEKLESLQNLQVLRRYKMLDVSPLGKLRHENGMPKLATFSPKSDKVRIGVKVSQRAWGRTFRETVFEPKLPPVLARQYTDIKALASKEGKSNKSIYYTVKMAMLIPQSVKDSIQAATPDFGENIFIIAETGEDDWQKIARPKTAVQPRSVDPLVVGVAGETVCLIDSFDLTPLEEYLKSEFTTP